jgi:crenactin
MSLGLGYKQKYVFGADYGTSYFKFGSIACGEEPKMIENRGYFPDKESIMQKAFGMTKEIIVGDEIPLYLQASEDLSFRLIYPMRNGVIEKNDEKAWSVVKEISHYGLNYFKPADPEFKGFYLVASLSSVAPRYMYERLFQIYNEINDETGLIKAATIIPQPLAVAIAHKITTCVVIESGHGNTQVCPISRYPIRNAIVAINRGGGDANAITTEILKDLGYSDLVHEEAFVIKAKESLGLIPRELEKAIEAAKKNPKKFKAHVKIPGTRITIELEENTWVRFLIGEYVFDPNHEIFQSYFIRGMPKPKDVRVGDIVFRGMLDFGDSIIEAVERCPIELQPHLYRELLLSGGNFCWATPPESLSDYAVDPGTKMKLLLRKKGITNVKVNMASMPQYSVWRGCVIYGFAVPEDYTWSWERMEGWLFFE